MTTGRLRRGYTEPPHPGSRAGNSPNATRSTFRFPLGQGSCTFLHTSVQGFQNERRGWRLSLSSSPLGQAICATCQRKAGRTREPLSDLGPQRLFGLVESSLLGPHSCQQRGCPKPGNWCLYTPTHPRVICTISLSLTPLLAGG